MTTAASTNHTHSIRLLHHPVSDSNSNTSHTMPHGLGLLTTVASLPPKYRSRYLNIKTKSEIPLDLSVKPSSPIPMPVTTTIQTAKMTTPMSAPTPTPSPQIANDVPIATTFTEVYSEPYAPATETVAIISDNVESAKIATTKLINLKYVPVKSVLPNTAIIVNQKQQQQQQQPYNANNNIICSNSRIIKISKPITPPLTPTHKRKMLYETTTHILAENAVEQQNEVTVSNGISVATVTATNAASAVAGVVRNLDDVYVNPLKMYKTDVQTNNTIINNTNTNTNPNTNTSTNTNGNSNTINLKSNIITTTNKRELTPVKQPINKNLDSAVAAAAPKTVKSQPPPQVTKSTKAKATRKLKFDEETSSPVSGTIIRPLEDITAADGTVQYSNGDIDPKYNIVEITEETKAELAAIKNVIGDYICKLCRIKFDDAFGLARHRCACIVLLEYRCPECGKQFNCPANLASHRRWHKPKKDGNSAKDAAIKKENRNTTNHNNNNNNNNNNNHNNNNNNIKNINNNKQNNHITNNMQIDELSFACNECGKTFKRMAYLRKHQQIHVANGVKKTQQNTVKEQQMQQQQHQQRQINQQHQLYDDSTNPSSIAISSSYGSGKSYAGSTSSASSQHSYNGTTHEDEGVYTTVVATSNYNNFNDVDVDDEDVDDDDIDTMSDCSNSSVGYGRLQIVETGLTEEENIAAAALTNLRNCASVIQHTTLAH